MNQVNGKKNCIDSSKHCIQTMGGQTFWLVGHSHMSQKRGVWRWGGWGWGAWKIFVVLSVKEKKSEQRWVLTVIAAFNASSMWRRLPSSLPGRRQIMKVNVESVTATTSQEVQILCHCSWVDFSGVRTFPDYFFFCRLFFASLICPKISVLSTCYIWNS